jgi:hypothetical protein
LIAYYGLDEVEIYIWVEIDFPPLQDIAEMIDGRAAVGILEAEATKSFL